MEPIDDIKKNIKIFRNTDKEKRDRIVFISICIISFTLFFNIAFIVVASKSSRMDIEYGRFGKGENAKWGIEETQQESEQEEEPKIRDYTVDKRLFLIQQEEKGPSESKVLKTSTENDDVISTKEFESIKNNTKSINTPKDEEIKKEQPKQEETEEQPQTTPAAPSVQKVQIKPKLPVNKGAVPISPISVSGTSNKVYIGKYESYESAKAAQNALPDMGAGIAPFVRKINNYYTIQVGSFDNFESAKNTAGKYKLHGLDVWILQ